MRREFVVKEGATSSASNSLRSGPVVAMGGIVGCEIGVRGLPHTFFRTHARERYGRVWTLLRREP